MVSCRAGIDIYVYLMHGDDNVNNDHNVKTIQCSDEVIKTVPSPIQGGN